MHHKSSIIKVTVWVLTAIFVCHCSSNQSGEKKEQLVQTETTPFDVSEDKSSLAKLYQLEHMQEWYGQRILPPQFNYDIDLSKKTATELFLLRNEIFARNGYLFDDAVLRGYFNQFPWYQPVFDVEGFTVQLNKQEQDFVEKILKLENEFAKQKYLKQGEYEMINLDQVYNLMQFKQIDDNLKKALQQKNFAIAPAKHEQLYYVYDHNHYQYVPNFITTDLYLQVLHKYFSSTLQRVEEDKFIPVLATLIKNSYQASVTFQKGVTDEQLKSAAQWSTTYLSIAFTLLEGGPHWVSENMEAFYDEEVGKINNAGGSQSEFLSDESMVYAQFTPRGNYTKTPELERYFRAVKWLNSAPVYIDNDERLLSAILIAAYIKNSPENLQLFQQYNRAIEFIVGEEDNLSIATIIETLTPSEAANPSTLASTDRLKEFRTKLLAREKNKIRRKGGDAETSAAVSRSSVLFTAGRYTFDAEILSRLTHILRPDPRRPFPKGLDVFASLGNKEAESILLNEFQEGKQWKQYPDSLKKLKNQFSKYSDWNKNVYTKTFDMINTLDDVNADYPRFMKTKWWDKKNLNTALAAWTELKHDMLLYAEQPSAAQAGQGGGPPPPEHVSYVEPNVAFWEKSLELLELQKKTLTDLNIADDRTLFLNRQLTELADFLLAISKKELANEPVSHDEFSRLSWIGGSIESLTISIFGIGILPEKERTVAIVADVYNYNGEFLEEGVGMADEIYVVVEINGKCYLAKGAVFSYYEFTNESPMTDEEWKEQVSKGQASERPKWMKDILVESTLLESKKEYSF